MTLHSRTDQMSHTIYLSSAWVKLRGANPQIEQRANRNSSTHLFFSLHNQYESLTKLAPSTGKSDLLSYAAIY